jgi:hypothetical protein
MTTQNSGLMSPEASRQNTPVMEHLESDYSDSDREADDQENLKTDNSTLQEFFAAEMQDIAQKRGHSRVGVLLIQWEVEDESFMDTREEVSFKFVMCSEHALTSIKVQSLSEVFNRDYHFSVHEKFLNTREPADNQLNCHLADFVRQEDDKNALLIVYYAGHGRVGKGKSKRKLYIEGYVSNFPRRIRC